MNRTNGADRMRQLQLQALAQNLWTLANQHPESRNYIVAHALYGHALEFARKSVSPQDGHSGEALVHRIEKDQQAIFEILGSREMGTFSVPREI